MMLQHFTTYKSMIAVDDISDKELPPDLLAAAPGVEVLHHSCVNMAPPINMGFSPAVDRALVELDIKNKNAIIQHNGECCSIILRFIYLLIGDLLAPYLSL